MRWRTDYCLPSRQSLALLYALVPARANWYPFSLKEILVNRIVYIVGAIVIIIAVLSFLGLR